MIRKIYFDWHKGTNELDKSFGQITFVDEYDEKLDVHNFDNVTEGEFKMMYYLYDECTKNIYVEYGRM